MTKNQKKYDVVIIGGGFYGCILALSLKRQFNSVLIIEKEKDLLTKASYFNQARIHNGYHYPRSHITALSSHNNFVKFNRQFKQSVINIYPSYYAIALRNSKVTAAQFKLFCQKVGAPIKKTPNQIKTFFNSDLIEEVFEVKEYEFSGNNLRKILQEKLKQADIKVKYKTEVQSVSKSKNQLVNIELNNYSNLAAKHVLNCSYSQINTILKNSKLPLLPLKFENTQMPLIKLPVPLDNMGITIMDGPFFSLLPFPDKKMHSLHHVRYTPLKTWHGVCDENKQFKKIESNFVYMSKDITRYIPILKNVKSNESLYQTKTILELNEGNDGRPILFRRNYHIPGFHLILGGKIDNVFDIVEEISRHGL